MFGLSLKRSFVLLILVVTLFLSLRLVSTNSVDTSLRLSEGPKLRHNENEVFAEECPRCTLKKENAQSLDVMLHKQSVNGSVIISTVTSGHIDFALNWLCSLKRAGVRNYLFHAKDIEIFNKLNNMGLPVVFFEFPFDKEHRHSE